MLGKWHKQASTLTANPGSCSIDGPGTGKGLAGLSESNQMLSLVQSERPASLKGIHVRNYELGQKPPTVVLSAQWTCC